MRGRVALTGLLAAGVASCSPAPRDRQPTEAPVTPPPIVTTADAGLEVHWWITDDTDGAVGRALAAWTDPAMPPDPALRDAWSLNGFRMVRAPALDLAEISTRLPPVHMRQRQWVGWVTRWTEVFRGRRAGGAVPLLIDAQRRSLPRGTLRVLLRCWPSFEGTGDAPERAVARLELAFQMDESGDEPAQSAFAAPAVVAPQSEGEVFRALTFSGALEEGFIYIITGEAPGVEWKPGAPGRAPESGPSASGAATESLGPPVSAPLTLGEAMFTRRADEDAGPPVKALLVLLPRTPDSYRLLP